MKDISIIFFYLAIILIQGHLFIYELKLKQKWITGEKMRADLRKEYMGRR